MKRSPVIQYAILAALCLFAAVAVIIIFGEEDPNKPMSLFEFFVLKGLAVFALYGMYNFGVWLKAHDMIPARVLAFLAKCEEEEDEL